MTVRDVGKFTGTMAVYTDPDELDMRMFRAQALEDWRAALKEAGGEPYGDPPTVEEVPNPSFGMVVTDNDGNPVLKEDGSPLLDPVRFTMVVTGRCLKPIGGDTQ